MKCKWTRDEGSDSHFKLQIRILKRHGKALAETYAYWLRVVRPSFWFSMFRPEPKLKRSQHLHAWHDIDKGLIHYNECFLMREMKEIHRSFKVALQH